MATKTIIVQDGRFQPALKQTFKITDSMEQEEIRQVIEDAFGLRRGGYDLKDSDGPLGNCSFDVFADNSCYVLGSKDAHDADSTGLPKAMQYYSQNYAAPGPNVSANNAGVSNSACGPSPTIPPPGRFWQCPIPKSQEDVVLRFDPARDTGDEVIVNSWTQWGKMEEVIVATLPPDACYPEEGPDFHGEANNLYLRQTMRWPRGPKDPRRIQKANEEYDLFAEVLEGEGITVKRPDPIPQDMPTVTPFWKTHTQYNCCPRDKLIVVGRELLEASMSQRSRFFEEWSYRPLLLDYFRRDKGMIWTAAPKPMMCDPSYRDRADPTGYWDMSMQERWNRMHKYEFSTTEFEPMWDAADITRLGKDIFVQHSKTTNRMGFEWLQRHLEPKGHRVHMMHFPYDIFPSHIDCTFVPLRPGLVLTNYERPPVEEEVKMFREGGWRFIDCPKPCDLNFPMPDFCQSSHWLAMNILVLAPDKVIIEENEKELYNLLHDEHGFDVLTTPFRNCYEFGGALHCASADIRRDEQCKDHFAVDYN